MVGYKLSKNDWVTPFFVIFRSVREILLVTVFFDHPVAVKNECQNVQSLLLKYNGNSAKEKGFMYEVVSICHSGVRDGRRVQSGL